MTSLRDLLRLTKPHILLVSTLVAAGGMALAPDPTTPGRMLLTLLGVGLIVGGASALNMYVERDLDRLMTRTQDRPLPAGRLTPRTVLVFGLALCTAATLLLALWVNLLTAAVGLVGLAGYIGLYTPLKRRTPLALLVGAIPGALPPLMGWTAATGRISLPGLVLFSTLFLWQIPHFMAIAIYRRGEYARAGFRTAVDAVGERRAWTRIVIYSLSLLVVSLVLLPLGVAGWIYASSATVLGLGLLAVGIVGMRQLTDRRWAVRFFRATLVYLPLLAVGLVLDRALG